LDDDELEDEELGAEALDTEELDREELDAFLRLSSEQPVNNATQNPMIANAC
jgi:hypothetical protein